MYCLVRECKIFYSPVLVTSTLFQFLLCKEKSGKPVYSDITLLKNVGLVVSHSILILKELKMHSRKSLN